MNKNYIIHKELQSLNEFAGARAETKGGEIDSLIGAVGSGLAAAGAFMVKALYNRQVYKNLTGELPNFLKLYKLTEAPKSRDVWDNAKQKTLFALKREKAMLLGSGGERVDKDSTTASRGETDAPGDEKSAKQQIDAKFSDKIKAADDANKPELATALRKQKTEAKQRVDLKIQSLQKKIEQEDAKSEVEWERAKENWRQYDEKFKLKADKFVEVKGVLGSSWKKRWEEEFAIAKANASIEVLAEAKKIAIDKNNKNDVDAITKIQDRDKQTMEAAKEAMAGIESDMKADEKAQADASQFGIDAVAGLDGQRQDLQKDLFNKWTTIAEKVKEKEDEPADDGDRGKTGDLKQKIKTLEEKITKAEAAVTKMKEAGKDDVVTKIQDLIEKYKKDIESFKSEIESESKKESFGENEYYSLIVRLNETSVMIDELNKELGVYEADEEPADDTNENPSLGEIKVLMFDAIRKAPADEKKNIASDALKDVKAISNLNIAYAQARNKMVELFDKNSKAEGDDKKDVPTELESFSKLAPVDFSKYQETVDKFAETLKEMGADEPEGVKDPETELSDNDDEAVKKQKEAIKKTKDNIESLKVDGKIPDKLMAKGQAGESLTNLLQKQIDKLKELQPKEEAVDPDEELEDTDDEIENTKDETPDIGKPKPAPKFMKFEDYIISKQKK